MKQSGRSSRELRGECKSTAMHETILSFTQSAYEYFKSFCHEKTIFVYCFSSSDYTFQVTFNEFTYLSTGSGAPSWACHFVMKICV